MQSFSKDSGKTRPILLWSAVCASAFVMIASSSYAQSSTMCPAGTTCAANNGVNNNAAMGATNDQSGTVNNGTVGNTSTGIGGTSVGTGNTVSGMAPNTNANGMVNTGSTAGIHEGSSSVGAGIGGTAGAHR